MQPNTTVPDVDGLREEWASESGQVHIFSALTQHCFLLQTQNTGFNRPLIQLTHISHVLMLSMGRSFFLLGTIYKTHRLVLVHIQPVKSHVIYYLATSNVWLILYSGLLVTALQCSRAPPYTCSAEHPSTVQRQWLKWEAEAQATLAHLLSSKGPQIPQFLYGIEKPGQQFNNCLF